MRNILVTGGAGFIGSHTCLSLLKSGFNLVVLDSFVNSSPESLRRVSNLVQNDEGLVRLKVIRGDIRDISIVREIFSNQINIGKPIDAVIHFAGLKSVANSFQSPLSYWDVNVNGTRILLSAMKEFKCFTLVFSSSATVYGNSDVIPIPETADLKPINPYGQTKVAIENMLTDLYYSSLNIFKFAFLRYFNPVGAHPSGLIGEDPLGDPENLFPYISQVAIGRKLSLKVFGDDWDTYDGTPIRDYIHVMDLAEGHILALNYLNENKPQIFKVNLGSGIGYSVFDVINAFEKATNCKVLYEIKGRRSGDVGINLANISLAKNKLGWVPKRSLSESCIDGWNWQVNNPKGYK